MKNAATRPFVCGFQQVEWQWIGLAHMAPVLAVFQDVVYFTSGHLRALVG